MQRPGDAGKCQSVAIGANAAALHAALESLRAPGSTCAHRDAIAALAVASGVDVAVLDAYLRDPGHGTAGEAAIWNARAALAAHDAHTAVQLLASAAVTSPSPVAFAEWARAALAVGDAQVADAALRQAIALATLEHPGSVSTGIPEAVHERFVASPDGRRWSSYGLRRIKVRDTLTGLEIAGVDLQGDDGPRGLALFNDGRVAFHRVQDWVRIIDPSTSTAVQFEQSGMLAPHPVGDRLAIVNKDSIAFTDARRGREGADPAGFELGEAGWPSALSWSGDLLLGHFWSTEVRVWYAADRHEPRVTTWPKGNAASAMTEDGTRVALARGPQIELYEPRGEKSLGVVQVPPGASIDNLVFVAGILYAADTALGDLFRADGDNLVALARGLPLAGPLPGDHWVPLGASTRVLAASGAVIELVPRSGGPRVIRRIAPGSSIEGLAWSPGGQTLAVVAGGALSFLDRNGVRGTRERVARGMLQGSLIYRRGTEHLWWVTPDGVTIWKGRAATVIPVEHSPEPHRAGATTNEADWNHQTMGIMESIDNDPGRAGIVTLAERRFLARIYRRLHPEQWADLPCFAISEDGSTLVIHSSAGAEIDILDTKAASVMALAAPGGVTRIALVDHDRRIVRSDLGQTTVTSLKRGIVERQITGELAAISEDGHWLVSENINQYHLHDLRRNRDLGQLSLGEIAVVMFDPAGARLAVGTYDGTVAVLEAPQWNVVAKWAAHDGSVDALAWRPDGALLATGGDGGVLRIWKPSGEAVTEIALGETLPPSNGEPDPDWIAVFPDGTATGTDLGRAHVALRVGATPLGLGVAMPPPAPASHWAALFSAPAGSPPDP